MPAKPKILLRRRLERPCTPYTALTKRKPNVLYTVVKQTLKNCTMPMLLPRRTLDGLIAKQLGLTTNPK